MNANALAADQLAPSAPSAPLAPTATRYVLDAGHSSVGFSVRHLMITNVRGEFARFRATVEHDPARPEATRIEAVIDVASLSTREPKRDEDLKSALFFDVERHPEMTFVSTGARATGEGALEVAGRLTLRGVSREVTLAVSEVCGPRVDMRGQRRLGATASAKISRSDFGMTWNKALEAGGVVVGDVVSITLEISLVEA